MGQFHIGSHTHKSRESKISFIKMSGTIRVQDDCSVLGLAPSPDNITAFYGENIDFLLHFTDVFERNGLKVDLVTDSWKFLAEKNISRNLVRNRLQSLLYNYTDFVLRSYVVTHDRFQYLDYLHPYRVRQKTIIKVCYILFHFYYVCRFRKSASPV